LGAAVADLQAIFKTNEAWGNDVEAIIDDDGRWALIPYPIRWEAMPLRVASALLYIIGLQEFT
jgi:hypothetical protein